MSHHDRNKLFNILHVVTRLPVGGVENMLLKIINSYDKERFNPMVCCIKEGGEIADELKKIGYKVEILNRMKGHGFDYGAVMALYRLIKKENIHILRTHQYHANLYGRIAGILSGVPVIIPSFHSRYLSPDMPKIHRRILNRLLGYFSDRLVAVSKAVAADVNKYDGISKQKIKIIYNGIPLDKFKVSISQEDARKVFNLPLDRFIVGGVGRLKQEKGYDILIKAVSKIKDASVVLAGDGPLRSELQAFAKELQVDCIFMGMLSPDLIPKFLKTLDIFCFPSLWEGFGIALVEAMASGLPIIASDIPPHREVLGDAGILVPPRDAESIANAINMLLSDHNLRASLIKSAHERSMRFTIQNTVKQYEELFTKLLSKKGLI